MELNDFVTKFAEQFEDTDPTEIDKNTKFHELDEWSSLTGMAIIALVKTAYGKTVTGKDLNESITVEDLYKRILNK